MVPSGFIEITCLDDGKRALIRTDLIEAIYEYGERKVDYGVKPAHVQICYGDNKQVDCIESYDEIANQIWKSEL